jgi:hypothetical protein
MNFPNKLECYIKLVCRGRTLELIGIICKLQRKRSDVNTDHGAIAQLSIFMVTYEWAKKREC